MFLEYFADIWEFGIEFCIKGVSFSFVRSLEICLIYKDVFYLPHQI